MIGIFRRQSLAPSHRDYLSKVVRFLHYFGEYEDIVVRCARKMESKRWPRLFNEVGEPAALLELCYMSHRFRTAACLLVVLQEMWGYMSTTHHVIRLLDRAVRMWRIHSEKATPNLLKGNDMI